MSLMNSIRRSAINYRNDPRRMQHRVSHRPVKGKIHGNLFDHKQTLGYTGHWAVLSERRSNTVNTCAHVARVRVRERVRARDEVSQVRACKRTLHGASSAPPPPPPPPSLPRRSMQRSHASRPRRGPRAFYLTSTRQSVQTCARACTPNGR